MDCGYDFDLAAAGLSEGNIVSLGDGADNRKRVVYCARLERLALQNAGEDGLFLDITSAQGAPFWQGGLDKTFILPTNYRGPLDVVGFQPVLRSERMRTAA